MYEKCRRTTWSESRSATTGTFLKLSQGAMRQHVTSTSIQKIGELPIALHMGGSGVIVGLNARVRRMNNAQNKPTAAHPQKRLRAQSQWNAAKVTGTELTGTTPKHRDSSGGSWA